MQRGWSAADCQPFFSWNHPLACPGIFDGLCNARSQTSVSKHWKFGVPQSGHRLSYLPTSSPCRATNHRRPFPRPATSPASSRGVVAAVSLLVTVDFSLSLSLPLSFFFFFYFIFFKKKTRIFRCPSARSPSQVPLLSSTPSAQVLKADNPPQCHPDSVFLKKTAPSEAAHTLRLRQGLGLFLSVFTRLGPTRSVSS